MTDYEPITHYLPLLETGDFGHWVAELGELPWVAYSSTVQDFVRAFSAFSKNYKEADLRNYTEYLPAGGADLRKVTPVQAMAYILDRVRGDRFCEGCLFCALENGSIQCCLTVLQHADAARAFENTH